MEKSNIIGMKTLKIQDGVTVLKRIKVKILANITRMAKSINILVLRIALKRTQSFDLLLLY